MIDLSQNVQSVFIGGAPRSGTTLLGAILGSHTRMLATPESQFKFELTPFFKEEHESNGLIREFINHHPRFAIWKFSLDWEKINAIGQSEVLQSIVRQYGDKFNKPDFTHWIDHTPANLRHSYFLDSIYPGCLFIHIVRDGRAVMASQFKVDFGSNDPVFATIKWMETIALCLACEAAFPTRTLRVHYEQLVQQPEMECARICQFIGVPYEPAMIFGTGYEVPKYSQKQHSLVGTYPNATRINDWKTSLTMNEIQLFESLTYDLLPLLGYEKVFPGIHPKPNELRQAWILFKGAVQYLTLNASKRKARFKKNT